MLYLMRKQNESIIINNDIELTVVEIKGKSVKLGFTFPKGSSVLRKELYEKIMQENLAAAGSAPSGNESVGENDGHGDDVVNALGKLTLSGLGQSEASPQEGEGSASEAETE